MNPEHYCEHCQRVLRQEWEIRTGMCWVCWRDVDERICPETQPGDGAENRVLLPNASPKDPVGLRNQV